MGEPVMLKKTLLWPGKFTDRNGRVVEYTADDVRLMIQGTELLRESGYKVQAYPTHGTDDSRTIQGTWIAFWEGRREDGAPTVEALLHLMPGSDDPESVERLKRLDVSAVTAWDYGGGDEEIPLCILRADIVGSGAISGMPPFEEAAEVAKAISLSARTFELSAPVEAQGESRMANVDEKSKSLCEDESLDPKADGQDKEGEFSADQEGPMKLEEALPKIKEALGMADVPDDEARAQLAALMAPEGEAEEEEEEEEIPPPAGKAVAEMSSEIPATVAARIASLEKGAFDSEVNGRIAQLSSPIPTSKVKRVYKRYAELSAIKGHDYAMSFALELLDESISGAKKIAELSAATPAARKKHKAKKPEIDPKIAALIREDHERLGA